MFNTVKADVKNIIGRNVVDGKLLTLVLIKDIETISADVYEVDEDGIATYINSSVFETIEELHANFDDLVECTRELFGKTINSAVH